jgi:hypothetical protein
MWMLRELLCFVADVVPAWFFYYELMKAVGDIKRIIETIGRDGKCFAARCNLSERGAAACAETTIVFVWCFWPVSDHGVCTRD